MSELISRLERPVYRERTLLEGALYYLSVLRDYRRLVGITTVLAAAAAVGFSLLSISLPPAQSPLPNLYRSQAVLLVQSDDGELVTAVRASLGIPTSRIAGATVRDTGAVAMGVLESRYVLDRLAQRFDLAQRYDITHSVRSNTREAILQNADYRYNPATGALTIGYSSTDGVLAAGVVNTMVDLLQEWFSQQKGSTTREHLELLEAKLETVRGRIQDLEGQVSQFQKRYGVLTVEELSQAQTQTLTDLRTQLLSTELLIRNRASSSRIQDPELTRLRQQRDNLLELIGQVESGTGGPLGIPMPAVADLPDLALAFRGISSELAIQRRLQEALSEQYEVTRLTLEAGAPLQVLERGEVPDEKSGPRRARLCLVITLGAFLSACVAAIAHNAVVTLARSKAPRPVR